MVEWRHRWVGCVCMCLVWIGLTTAAHAAGFSKLKRIEISSKGELVGAEIQISRSPYLSIWVEKTGKVRWLLVRLKLAELLVAPGGKVYISRLFHRGALSIGQDDQNRLVSVGSVSLGYDSQNQNRLVSLSFPTFSLAVKYYNYGRFHSVGQRAALTYLSNGTLKAANGITMTYDKLSGRVTKLGPVMITYQTIANRISKVGYATLQYDALRGLITRLYGQEKRVRVEIMWHALNLCSQFVHRRCAGCGARTRFP